MPKFFQSFFGRGPSAPAPPPPPPDPRIAQKKMQDARDEELRRRGGGGRASTLLADSSLETGTDLTSSGGANANKRLLLPGMNV